ncbi:MAG TPA: response regulator [Vicinamibacterales bacterium]|nr:response regulator [Vicinamibacterales bacterium]
MPKADVAGELVLIVDDNIQNLKLVRLILANEGYDIRTAVDAEEALALLRTSTPHVILMDLQLPGMDGLQLARQLKADSATRGIRIIALTAYAMKGDEEKAFAAGCDGYVSKPIDTERLPAIVRSHVSGAEAGNERIRR